MSERMSPRERVLAALDHREPDLVPFDLGSTKVTSIGKEAYLDLVRAMGMEIESLRIANVIGQLPALDPRFLEAVGATCVGIEPRPSSAWHLEISRVDEYYQYYDEWGVRIQMPVVGGHFFDRMEGPIAEPTMEALERYSWPDPDDPARYAGLRDEALRIRQKTSYALAGSCALGTDITSRHLWMRGYVVGMMDLIENPAFIDALLDRCTEIGLRAWDRFLA